MANYLVRLGLDSPLATPLHSGTIFGHLCWALRELEGEAALERWLGELREDPFLVSDGFPSGWLPRPLLVLPRPTPPEEPSERRRFFDELKKRRKATLMRVQDFLRLRSALSAEALEQAPVEQDALGVFLHEESMPHNRIDRRSGHTLEEGGLFFLDEFWPHPDRTVVDVYVRCSWAAERLARLFEHVGRCGYGRDATWGRGRFSVLAVEPEPAGLFQGEGNRLMSLSHGSLSANMREPRYRVECHIGRLGNIWARSERPFKYPLLLLKPGATFASDSQGPFGDLLDEVHPAPELFGARILHNAWHLVLPYREV
jgi:CRISPR-associated protein Csm4